MTSSEKNEYTFIATNGPLHLIGRTSNLESRIDELKKEHPSIKLVTSGTGVTKIYLQELYFKQRTNGDWFEFSEKQLANAISLIEKGPQKAPPVSEKDKAVVHGIKYVDNGRSYGYRPDRTGVYWHQSDEQKKRAADGRLRQERLNKNYVISFGKYKDTKITDMTSPEQINYVTYMYGEFTKNHGKGQAIKERRVKAFKWWLANYKDYVG